MCFLLLDLWFIIETKVIVQKLSCEKIFHNRLYGQILTAKYKSLTVKVETKYLFSLDNQMSGEKNNINTWHQQPHFIPNQKPTLTLQTYGFAPLTDSFFLILSFLILHIVLMHWYINSKKEGLSRKPKLIKTSF